MLSKVPKNRQQQIMEAAAALFADNGYYKTTTADVARAIGVTQPYVFHFFKSKEELYLAVLDKAFGQINDAFLTVESSPDTLRLTMGQAFSQLLADYRNEMLLVVMSYTIPEPAVRQHSQQQFKQIYEQVRSRFEQAGIPRAADEARSFIAEGLLIVLAETLQLPQLFPWYDDGECK